MNDEIRQALLVDPNTIIDITTTGRKSGEPRRIETNFRRVDGEIYLSGLPMPRPRAWLLNLQANPSFTFHLKHGVVADLPATATVITDPDERRRIMTPIVAEFEAHWTPDSPYPKSPLETWIAHSPLAKVTFDEID
jgi:deazaflavin-dependent oxidoreductase (nitroreductase family)